MSQDLNRERLDRLRSDLAELRTRATAGRMTSESSDGSGDAANGQGPEGGGTEEVPASFSARPTGRRRPRPIEVGDREPLRAERPATISAEPPTDLLGRAKAPRPPRRNPLRRRAHRPPDRLAVPAPVPVPRRSAYLAGPRWPQLDLVSGLVIALVLVPVVAALAFRLWTAMSETSFLLGADPSRLDYLRAAAGVAGGGLTTAAAVAALGVVRGRIGYVASSLAVLLLFVVFPFMAYRSAAGIVAAPLPTFEQMLAPEGWARAGQLRAVFLLAVGALVLSLADLVYRSTSAVQRGLERSRELPG